MQDNCSGCKIAKNNKYYLNGRDKVTIKVTAAFAILLLIEQIIVSLSFFSPDERFAINFFFASFFGVFTIYGCIEIICFNLRGTKVYYFLDENGLDHMHLIFKGVFPELLWQQAGSTKPLYTRPSGYVLEIETKLRGHGHVFRTLSMSDESEAKFVLSDSDRIWQIFGIDSDYCLNVTETDGPWAFYGPVSACLHMMNDYPEGLSAIYWRLQTAEKKRDALGTTIAGIFHLIKENRKTMGNSKHMVAIKKYLLERLDASGVADEELLKWQAQYISDEQQKIITATNPPPAETKPEKVSAPVAEDPDDELLWDMREALRKDTNKSTPLGD